MAAWIPSEPGSHGSGVYTDPHPQIAARRHRFQTGPGAGYFCSDFLLARRSLITAQTVSRFLLAALAIAGGVLVFLVTAEYGPGISTDGVEYLSAADSFSRGEGFVNYKGQPYHLWSPFYPFLLAVPRMIFGFDTLQTGWVLNILANGLIIWLSWLVVRKAVPDNPIWAYLGAFVALSSVSLLGVAANIASDPIFIVMVLVFFLVFSRYAETGSRRLLVALIVIAGFAAVQRYLGVTLIAGGFIGILYSRRKNRAAVLLDSVSFSVFASIPVVGWVLRNWFLTGTMFGVRDPSKWLLGENIRDASVKILHWFLPFSVGSNRIFQIAVLGVLFLGLTRIRKVRLADLRQKFNQPISIIILLFSACYLGLILVLTKTEDHPELYDDRYYTPLLVPLLALIFLFLQTTFFTRLKDRQLRVRSFLLVLLFGAWMIYPVFSVYKLWNKTKLQSGVPHYNLYNLPRFRDSPVTRELENILPTAGGPIYSNYSAAVYLFTRRETASSPSNRGAGEARTPLEAYAGEWPEAKESILVWYEPNTKGYLYTPRKLQAIGTLDPIFESGRGGIYLVDPLTE